jgi:hypothetical protein
MDKLNIVTRFSSADPQACSPTKVPQKYSACLASWQNG